MYCIYSRESIKKMGGNRGKMAAMAGHAYLHAFWDALELDPPFAAYTYKHSDKARKIALIVETDAELEAIYMEYVGKLGTTKVVDSALTVFTEPTLACIGLGPCGELEIPGSKIFL
jgi:peptidyl-tRNA hydrolase